MPVLMHWHSDPNAFYLGTDCCDRVEIKKALISDERKQRRRTGDYEVDLVTIRDMQFVTRKTHCDFSGVERPKEDAIIEIENGKELYRYVIEQVTDGDHGMAKMQLRRTDRILIGSRETIEQ